MGFKVDTAEIRKAIDSYQKTAATATEELSSAKTAMNGIITSNAMHGQVGQAIEADINNNQNAVIVGLADSYTAMSMEMTKLYQSFKEATGETSDNAILKQDVLEKASKKIDSLKEDHQEILSNITNIYSSVADLISLTTPKSTFNESADEVKKYANKIIEKVTTFDSQQGNSANEDMLAKLKTQIQSAEKVSGLSYTDPQFLAFANSTSLAEEVQDYHSSISKEAEKLRKEKEKDLNSMTPSEMIAKYGVNDPDVKKRINDINNGISDTAIGLGGSVGSGLLGNSIEKGFNRVGTKLSNNIFSNRYSITLPDGRILGQTSGATAALRKTAENTAKGFGRGFSEVGGTLVGVGIDLWQGDTAEEAWGKEITSTVVTGIGTAILSTTPLGAGIGMSIAVGIIVGWGNDWLRDNFDGVKEFEDNIGNAVVSTFNKASKDVNNFFGGIFA